MDKNKEISKILEAYKNAVLQSSSEEIYPYEKLISGTTFLDQYTSKVIYYSSRYCLRDSIKYSPDNLVGRYDRYPSYGDYSETYALRSYGKWPRESEAYQHNYRFQDVDPLGAEDFVTLGFETGVVPRSVFIYETYNPGAVVRIWGRYTGFKWVLLWQGTPEVCAENARKFAPKIYKFNYLVNEVRLEFNQSHLKYHTAIDCVILTGVEAKNSILFSILKVDMLGVAFRPCKKEQSLTEEGISDRTETGVDDANHFNKLPDEVILHIFQNLDLLSLSKCSQVCELWRQVVSDPVLYQNLSLKNYWYKANKNILDYFRSKCKNLRKLDLSWCGTISTFQDGLTEFFDECCKNLTHLSLCNCDFEYGIVSKQVSLNSDLTELRLVNIRANSADFLQIANLKKLVTLDVSLTRIDDNALMEIIKANRNLKHLNVDLCEDLKRIDNIVEAIADCGIDLRTWSSFKVQNFTAVGVGYFAECPNLTELDLGWCLNSLGVADSLEKIAGGCKKLKRLILSSCRELTDTILSKFIINCQEITQLDLLKVMNINGHVCRSALLSLPNLRLLDVSFCDLISDEDVSRWRVEFPNVTIQRSYQDSSMSSLH